MINLPMKFLRIQLCVLVTALCPLAGVAADPPPSAAERQLAEIGVGSTSESIGGLLRSMLKDERREDFAAAVGNLGAPAFGVRESAAKWLCRATAVHWDLLEDAAASGDPEIRFRARSVIEFLRKSPPAKRHAAVQWAAFRVIEEREIGGLADLLLQVMPKIREPHLLTGARRALVATSGKADIGVLRTALSGDLPAARTAALAALESVLGERVAPDAGKLLADPVESVRLAAARTLGNLGRREALPVLVDLLHAEAPVVRSRSAFLLRHLSGRRFDYSPRAPADERSAAVARWSGWTAGEGRTAALQFPVGDYTVDTGGLVLHFTFAIEGARVTDASGNANHGVPHGASWVAGGRSGRGAGGFDGKGDYVSVANSKTLEITGQLTLAAWIKLDSFGPGGYGNEEGHIIKKGDPLWWNPGFGLGYRKASRKAKFVIGHPKKPTARGGADLAGRSPLETGRWHHLAGTYDGKVARLFIDGELDAEKEYVGKIRGDGAPVMLGGGKLFSPSEFANHFAIHGTVDEVRIYNRPLSPDEIELLAGN